MKFTSKWYQSIFVFMVFGYILRFLQNLFTSIKYKIMGDTAEETGDLLCNVIVPPIPKLGDAHTYWIWRLLIKSYLTAIGLWSRGHPKECAHAKFVILSSLEIWVLRKEYDDMSCKAIFENLEERFSVSNTRPNSLVNI
ncbi:uncharacterized protein LOC108111522 [Drosophila eugracilis]|uniref:uncharacterized protein LOC108111522 n=1 Tax=Drosophila eugracilis TaxID=29029 RepID=UPI001BD91FEE|nr:uncharacterized protein LOC108111522 [Drosophila eugracilis]